MNKKVLLGFVGLMVTASAAQAQMVNKEWEAHGGSGYCYNVSMPVGSSGGPTNRGDAYVAVTHNASQGIRDSVSFVSGFSDVSGSKVTVDIDGKKFDLLPYQQAAFIKSGEPEQDMIASMRRGRNMTVEWVSPGGRRIVDKYSLMGFTATHNEINKRCPS